MMAKRGLASLSWAAACALLSGVAGCEDIGAPGTLRFGQIGEVRLHLSTPLGPLGEGELQQTLTWNSLGPWQLTEAILYRREFGDDNTLRSTQPPELLATNYAVWITQVNDIPSLELFIPELDPKLDLECGVATTNPTKATLTIFDDALGEERSWSRCVEGNGLSTLVTSGAGPDPAASRIANAALILRDYVFPNGFQSSFHGSLPFATVAKADNTSVTLDVPIVIETRDAWVTFWTAHTGSPTGLPTVDFNNELVIIGAVGQRPEAGETVEVRKVRPVGQGTLVQVVLRVPGNFCSPVARAHRPIHVVVVPQLVLPRPVNFEKASPSVPWSLREEVPCGLTD
jgi:hypothetical protein